MTYSAEPQRYDGRMPYRVCGRSGLRLPAISLGLWHNFGDATLAAVAALGVEPEKPPYHPGGRADLPRIAFVADPDGYRIELIDGGTFATPQDADR